MNIIEALKSGKNFKRKSWSKYLSYEDGHRFCCLDILADDWEVQQSGDAETLVFRLAKLLGLE